MSSLFKSKPASSTTNSTSTTVKTLPDWLQSAYQSLVGDAQAAAGMGVSQAEQSAIDLILGNIQRYQPGHDLAATGQYSVLEKALAGGPSASDLEAGMNPYLQSVLDRQRKEAQKSFYDSLAGLQDQEANAGAFGGSRSAVARQLLQDNYADNLDKIMNEGLYNAFETSRNQYNLNQQQAANSAVNLANQSTAGQQGILTSGAAIESAGALPRNVAQGNLGFLNSVVAPAASTMVGGTTDTTATTTGTSGSGSLFGKLLGAGLSIAGMASGGGLGGLSSLFAPQLSQGALMLAGKGGLYRDGGLVGSDFMPEWIANAPDLTWEEKVQVWEQEGFPIERQRDKAAADAEWAAEEARKPYMSKNDPVAEGLLDAVLGDVLIPGGDPESMDTAPAGYVPPSPLKTLPSRGIGQGSAKARTSGGNLIERGLFGKGELPQGALEALTSRHPGLQKQLDRVNSLSDEDLEALFTMSEDDLNKLRPKSSNTGVMKFFTGGLTPDKMSAEEEELYWASRSPYFVELFGRVNRPRISPDRMSAAEEDAYWGARNPNANTLLALTNQNRKVESAFGEEVERNSRDLYRQSLRDQRLDRDRRLVEGVSKMDSFLDRLRASPDVSGKSRLDKYLTYAGAMPRQLAGVAGEAGLLPMKGGVALGAYLAENPEEAVAREQLASLRTSSQMSTEERDVQDALNSGVYSAKEIEDAVARRKPATTKQVGEVTDSSGKAVPVEAPIRPTRKEVEQAVRAEEAKPEEERGMNMPLIMAGMALLTSKGDAFESLGEGLAAYLGGKKAIADDKKAAAKEARDIALAERAMQVDEGKLDVMRQQIGVDLARLSADAAKAGKEAQYTRGQMIDDYSNLFKTILDNEIVAASGGGGVKDMDALLTKVGDRTLERLYHAQGLTPPVRETTMGPLDRMFANMQNAPKR